MEPIPDVEWWDARILSNGLYPDPADASDSEPYLGIKTELITSYVEHPVPIEPPAEAAAPPPRPLMLTKKVLPPRPLSPPPESHVGATCECVIPASLAGRLGRLGYTLYYS